MKNALVDFYKEQFRYLKKYIKYAHKFSGVY